MGFGRRARWAIATPHDAATRAGAAAFERGGTAMDAAIHAAVTLAVAYPHMCGVGGDLFALVQRADGEMLAINSAALPHRSRPPGAGRPRRDADPRSRPGDGAGGGRRVAGDPHHRGRAPLALGVRDRDRPRRGRRRGQPLPRRRVRPSPARPSQQIRASPRSSTPTGTPPSWARPSATQRSLARSRRWPPKAPPRSTAAPSGMPTSPGSRPLGRRSATTTSHGTTRACSRRSVRPTGTGT